MNPDGFNIGLNDGEAAGQTVDHAHIHIIPGGREMSKTHEEGYDGFCRSGRSTGVESKTLPDFARTQKAVAFSGRGDYFDVI